MNDPEGIGRGGVSFGASGSLVERTIARLSGGPMSTARVAEEILALRGNPKIAAAAVFALLGSDPRFVVDGSGTWSLAEGHGSTVSGKAGPGSTGRTRRVRPGSSGPMPGALSEIDWVVVDVETTGGSPATGDRVIEFAAVLVSGGRIVDSYSSLVNPGRPIPRMITRITGIADDEVRRAPGFDDIASRVTEVLGGRVFVGHNAGFDWGFVRAEMERSTGRTLVGRQFCTLKVARRLLPHLRSRSLGALADYYGVEMVTHHRALDDATATARLLLRFLDVLAERGIEDWRSYEAFLGGRTRRPRRVARPTSIDRE
jgi:DNA polymerase-3 subunit epsilon